MYATELGKTMRMIRARRNENLASLSDKYGASIAYLSSIEVGKKAIPDDYADKINAIYKLTNEEFVCLQNAIDDVRQRTTITYDGLNEERKDLIKVFARKINTVNQQSLEKLRKLLEEEK